MKTVYFTRHGQTVWNVEKKFAVSPTAPSPTWAVSRPGPWPGSWPPTTTASPGFSVLP